MLNTAWALVRDTVDAWLDDYAPSMGAALAFYTLFSIAPLLLIVISVAGLLFGEPAARGEILAQLTQLVGTDSAVAVDALLQGLNRPRAGIWGTVVGLVVVVAGATTAKAAGPDPLITEVQDWASAFGDPVDAAPYGMPIRFESHVTRRNVEWLTESPVSSINFTPIHALDGTITPQGCAFERHHSGAIELSKQDYRLMINGLVDRPLVFTFEDLMRFPRHITTAFCECAANGGMEWGGAQLEGCQFTQGMIHNMEYTGVMLRDLLAEAGIIRGPDIIAGIACGQGFGGAALQRQPAAEDQGAERTAAHWAGRSAMVYSRGWRVRGAGSCGFLPGLGGFR